MADYSINAVSRKVSYTGSAGLGPYVFSFEILDDDDIAVYLNETLLTKTTDYDVTINVNGTGSITLKTGGAISTTPTASDLVVILGSRDIERTTDFVTAGDLRASALNEQLDALTIFMQQIKEEVDRSVKAPAFDPTGIDMVLPKKADRVNAFIAFDANGDVSASIATDDVTTLAEVSTDIATLADIEDGTIATDAISDTAAIASDVTTVAGIAANVTSVANDQADIGTVASDLSGSDTIGTVAANISNVNAVAAIDSDVTAVAADATDIGTVATDLAGSDTIGTVAGIAANVTTVAGISADVTTVAGIDSDVTAVAADATDIGTVSTNIANVNTVAGISANVTTVAGIDSDVTAVAADATDIGTVASNIANVNTVAGISANVTTVAGLDTEIGALGARTTEIDALYAEIDDIGTKVTKTSDTGAAALPTGTTAQRDGTPSAGYIRFNSDEGGFEGYDGSAWGSIGGGATGGGSDQVFVENDQTVTANYTIPSGKNAMSTGPVSVNSGVTVTVSSGSRYVVI